MTEGPALYRHKPTEVQAMQFTPATAPAVEDWLFAELDPWKFQFAYRHEHLVIETLEGDRDVPADAGYWIVKGIRGEWYPVDPAVFADAYELAVDGA